MNKSEIAERAAREFAESFAMEVAYYIESMYPQAVKAAPKSFLVSVRGLIINKLRCIAGGEISQPIIKQALLSANEWAAKFPLSETDSKPDYNAASVVYAKTLEALTFVERAIAESQAWISVEEKLPWPGTINPHNTSPVKYWLLDIQGRVHWEIIWLTEADHPRGYGYTHWAEATLPDPPKGNENV